MQEEKEILQDEEKPFVIFQIKNEEFGVDVMNIKEIAQMSPIIRVPHSPKFIEGVINLRGTVIPIINLRKRFGFQHDKIEEMNRIIIVEFEERFIGILVDTATEVLRIPVSNIEPTPRMVTTEISKEYLEGVAKMDNRLIIILNLKQVLTNNEIEKMKEFNEKKIDKKKGKSQKKK